MEFLKRKRNSFKVTLDGKEHSVEVTKSTTCDDVIRKLLQSTGKNLDQASEYSVYKLSSGRVKVLDSQARIISGARMFWKTSTAVYVMKKRQQTLGEKTPRKMTTDTDSFCESPSLPSSFRELEERLKSKQLESRRTSLPALGSLHTVYSRTETNVSTRRSSVWNSSMNYEEEEEDFLTRVNPEETFGLTSGPVETSEAKQASERRASLLSNRSHNTTLVFKKALKTRTKPTGDRGAPAGKSTSDVTAISREQLQHCGDRLISMRQKKLDAPMETPLHSTPVTSARPASRLAAFSEDVNTSHIEGKKILLRKFFHHQESKYTYTDSPVYTFQERSALDTGFVADDLDEGIDSEKDDHSEHDLNCCSDEHERLEKFMNTVLYEDDSDEGLSSLEDESPHEVTIFV